MQDYEWCFSKLVENQDEIYISYFDEEEQKERKFYPDFIFWLKNKQNGAYKMLFVDPKGLGRSRNAIEKVKGFENIFSKGNLTYLDREIKVDLVYYNFDNTHPSELKDYVKSSIEEIFKF